MSPARWAFRGAAIGGLVAVGESFLAVSTGDGLPGAYLFVVLVVYSVVAGAGTLVSGLAIRRVVSRAEIPFPGVIVVFASILAWIWTFDWALDASTSRGLSAIPGVLLLVLVIAIAAFVGWRIAPRWLPSSHSEATLVSAVPLVILWLELVRFIDVKHFRLSLLAAGLAVVVIGCGRILSSQRFATIRAGSVLAVTLPVSAAGIGAMCILDLESQDRRLTSIVPAGENVDGKPNIILITLDTLRADRLGLYGYD